MPSKTRSVDDVLSECAESTPLVFFVNGKKIVEPNPDPEESLLEYLRLKLRISGPKNGCSEGGCGACTVMVSQYDAKTDTIKHISLNACLTSLTAVHHQAVTTVEGIGSVDTKLHPVQERLAKAHGSQCGFCTPGFIMAMYTLLRNNPAPTKRHIEEALQGNLCRCTGYRPILEGFYTFAVDAGCGGCCGGNGTSKGCCQNGTANGGATNGCCQDGFSNGVCKSGKQTVSDWSTVSEYDPSQDVIFPPELKLIVAKDEEKFISFKGPGTVWYRPTKLEQLLAIKTKHPDARLIVGNTEVGIERRFKKCHYPVLVQPVSIADLREWSVCEKTGVRVGAALSLTEMEGVLHAALAKMDSPMKMQVVEAIVKMLEWFAGKHIRNAACYAGNIMTASPIADLNPLFLAANCELDVASFETSRPLRMDESFFTGYRRNRVAPNEVIRSILIPYTSEDEYFFGYKQSPRREDDIATVNAGMRVLFESGTNIVRDVRIVFGGMATTTVFAPKTMKALIGKKWDEDLLELATSTLLVEMTLKAGTPGGMERYRQALCASFFFKFYTTVRLQLEKKYPHMYAKVLPNSDLSATWSLTEFTPMKATQIYHSVSHGQPADNVVGRPLEHLSGQKHASGEAVYCDDVHVLGEAHMALLLSSKAHAKIVSVDPSEALNMRGVIAYIDHRDIPANGRNFIRPRENMNYGASETIFADKEALWEGQVLGAIVAEEPVIARRALQAVKVVYEELPARISIEEAIAAESFFAHFEIKPKEELNFDDQTVHPMSLSGEMRTGGQEHFYLEPHAAIAIPKENDELEVISTTQSPMETQDVIAKTIGLPSSRVTVRVKRLGGGFGGKETRTNVLAAPCAVAAWKLKRPVRVTLERDEDMTLTGTRHPFLAKYKVLIRAIFHVTNAYNIPQVAVNGYCCITNIPSNTAFRGFGSPQAIFIMEHIITEVAYALNLSAEEVRRNNMLREGDSMFYGPKMTDCNVLKCWDECIEKAYFHYRRREIDAFNSKNRWMKRGISVVPTAYGIGWPNVLDQAGALIHVYIDGSVLLSHGGIEMGQGIHTKMVQVASQALNLPPERIHISETSTDKVPNTSPTAASSAADLNGVAVQIACETLLKRLEPIREAHPTGTWEEWIRAAYMERISLSATGFFRCSPYGFNFATQTGNPYKYFTFGAACAEVEVDCLTGDHKVLRTDIVMDVGDSLNPAVDIGQIEGAFIQGYGLYTLEEQKYTPSGNLLSKGPGMYKIPTANDCPREFNVHLLKASNHYGEAVHSSKAIGEPPLSLGSCIFFAIKDAIKSARCDAGLNGPFLLACPATAEAIRIACEDELVQKIPVAPAGSYRPWYVRL